MSSMLKVYQRNQKHSEHINKKPKFNVVHFTCNYEGWNFNSGNYLFTTDTK